MIIIFALLISKMKKHQVFHLWLVTKRKRAIAEFNLNLIRFEEQWNDESSSRDDFFLVFAVMNHQLKNTRQNRFYVLLFIIKLF